MTTILRLLGIHSDFERLFYIKEYQTLAGEKKRIIQALIAILFLTLVALSYAVGSIQNLEQKMNNPFTNWIDLSISEAYISKRARGIEEDYSKEAKKAALQLNDIRGWVMFNLEMYHQNFNPIQNSIDTLSYAAWGRTLEPDDPLLKTVLNKDNVIWETLSSSSEEEALANCEIIITEEMLLRLGYDSENENIGNIFVREGEETIIVKIVGVVRELPKFCSFISSSQFYNIKNAKREGSKNCSDLIVFAQEGDSDFTFLVEAKTEVTKLKELARDFFNGEEPPDIRVAEEFVSGEVKWGLCEMAFFPTDKPTLDSVRQFLHLATQKDCVIGEIIRLECSSDICEVISPENYYYLAFNFNRLDNVREFKEDIKKNHGVDIDMSQVEAKENFALVSRLTLAISLILLAFGILSIILFVNSLLKAHLFKVRSNLGTFKAFGLNNRFLNNTYLKIIFSFLFLSILIALGATIIIDRIEQWVMQSESQFNVFSSWILFALTGLVIISLFISFRTIKKILGDTPGNLIYER